MTRRLRSHKKCKLFPVAVALATLTIYIRFRNLHMINSESLNEIQTSSPKTKMKNIVWYQLFHGGLRMDAKKVDMNKCDYKNCQISFIENKVQEKANFASADAVLFQGGRLTFKPPQRANNDQVFVYANVESPVHLDFFRKGKEKQWLDTINWTMTYRTDSDILYKYGEIVPKQIEIDNRNYSQIFHSKTKQVAWFVSDCKTESLREKFVNKLKAHIDIDIYGHCGTLVGCSKEQGLDCLKTIAKDYKFYLSFENSLCRDYMTEKVYIWFNMDLITVVRGARDYIALLPDNTYIDTKNFKSVKGLASHLTTIGENEELYTKYLKSKAKYEAESYDKQFQKAYCEICKRLHNLETYRKSYSNIYRWWTDNACLRSIGDLF